MQASFFPNVRRLFVMPLVAAALLLFIAQIPTNADGSSVTINGVTLPEPSINVNGVTYVPMRSTFEALGAVVQFQGQSATATMNGSELLSATIGSAAATIKGVPKQLDAPVYQANGVVYIPITALATIFGARLEQTATGWNITSAAPRGGVPWWLWAIIALAIVALLSWFMRRQSVTAAPAMRVPRNPLVTALLGLIPTLSADHRIGIAGSIFDTFANRGYNAQSFQNAGVDVSAARSGNVDALSSAVQQAATFSPQVLRDAITTYAQRVPSFLSSLSPNVATSLRGLIGA